MPEFPIRSLVPAGVLLLTCGAAWAQTAPPIKPGLWQIHTERLVDGRKTPDVSERLATMPPEQRARMEAMMKQHGVAMGAGGTDMKVCLDRAALDAGHWQDNPQHAVKCKTDYATRGANQWKWHSSCTSPVAIESDGEAVFQVAENYTMKVTSIVTGTGVARQSQMTMTGKWLGASCGDVKPASPRP